MLPVELVDSRTKGESLLLVLRLTAGTHRDQYVGVQCHQDVLTKPHITTAEAMRRLCARVGDGEIAQPMRFPKVNKKGMPRGRSRWRGTK